LLPKKNEGLTPYIDFKINSLNLIFAFHSNHTVDIMMHTSIELQCHTISDLTVILLL